MYYNVDKKLIVSKSFKTASSSFFTYLSQNARVGNYELSDNHFTLQQMVGMYKLQIEEVTKIVQVRNPWDYVVSAYYWAVRNSECPSVYTFEDFVFKPSDFNWQKQLKWWDLDYIDNFIRYEYLEQDIAAFAQSFNFPYFSLGKEKSGIRPSITYQEIHTEDTKEYIAEFFKDQIQAFRYEY